jgi:hypothetical protein
MITGHDGRPIREDLYKASRSYVLAHHVFRQIRQTETAQGDIEDQRNCGWLTERERRALSRGLPTGSGRVASLAKCIEPETAARRPTAAKALDDG